MAETLTKDGNRTLEQLREHYEIEKELAARLRNAPRQERRRLYSALYDELFQRVPLHPQLTRKSSPRDTEIYVSERMAFIKPFLKKDTCFLEVGPGDCALSIEVARFVKQVYAVDVSEEITKRMALPENFKLVLSDGSSIPVPPECVNVAYSNQLMEHLHPEDAFEQLENIYKSLAPGGVYLCITPNRLNGPHDISKYFDEVAAGFHLKEYTTHELSHLFKKVGFSQVRVYIGTKGKINLPEFPIALFEKFLDALPYRMRKFIIRILPFRRALLGIQIVGTR